MNVPGEVFFQNIQKIHDLLFRSAFWPWFILSNRRRLAFEGCGPVGHLPLSELWLSAELILAMPVVPAFQLRQRSLRVIEPARLARWPPNNLISWLRRCPSAHRIVSLPQSAQQDRPKWHSQRRRFRPALRMQCWAPGAKPLCCSLWDPWWSSCISRKWSLTRP